MILNTTYCDEITVKSYWKSENDIDKLEEENTVLMDEQEGNQR